MGSAKGMLDAARASLGTSGRPNKISRDYAARHGSGFLRAPWCDMAVTYWARNSNNERAVLTGGDRAYTVWHAQDFQRIGRWHTGTAANVDRAKPGDIVFFDWGQSNAIGAIDHVGVVEKALGGGRVQTIEGNTGDRCLRRVRSANHIAGYGRPAYAEDGGGGRAEPRLLRLTTPPMEGEDVEEAQRRLNVHGADPKLVVDGVFGQKTDQAVRTFQRLHRLEVDGIIGAETRAALARRP